MSTPKKPTLCSIESRKKTFIGKDGKYSCDVSKLVNAGFYYIGPDDNVRCFHCDGGLKNFKDDDDPLTEHMRYFPTCAFIMGLKSKQQSSEASSVKSVDLKSKQQSSEASSVKSVDTREIKSRMELPINQRLISIGYKRDYIRDALMHILSTRGDDFKDVEEMITWILDNRSDALQEVMAVLYRNTSVTSVETKTVTKPVETKTVIKPVETKTVIKPVETKTVMVNKCLKKCDNPITSITEVFEFMEIDEKIFKESIMNKELMHAYHKSEMNIKCCICLEKERDTIFLPCGHFVTCNVCAKNITHCCMCRQLIRGTVKALLCDVSGIIRDNIEFITDISKREISTFTDSDLKNVLSIIDACYNKLGRCKRCANEVNILDLPCRHIVGCEQCTDVVKNCFECNEEILGTCKLYYS